MNGLILILGTLAFSMLCALFIGRFIRVGDREPVFTIELVGRKEERP